MELITKLKDFLYSILGPILQPIFENYTFLKNYLYFKLQPLFEILEPISEPIFEIMELIFTVFLPFMLIYVIGMVLIQAYAIIRFLIPSKKVPRAFYLVLLGGAVIWPYLLLLVIKDWISGKK